MYRHLLRAAALILAIGLHGQAARAQDNSIWTFLFGKQDPRLTATGIAIGLGADGASYALTHKHGVPAMQAASPGFAYGITSLGCVVVYPILGTIVLQRALTPREAYMGMADCLIPFVGGRIVDALLPHTAWNDGLPAGHPGRPHHHKQHHRKQN